MTLGRPRATGYYATFMGREFHATTTRSEMVVLRSYRDELTTPDFSASRIPMVQGIRVVRRAELENLSFVRTVCTWQREPFVVVGVDASLLYVLYTGARGEWVTEQPGMVRTGKLEAHGRLDRAQVDEVYEFVDPLPL